MSVAELVTTFIFFSAWDKSRIKWDISRKPTQTMNLGQCFGIKMIKMSTERLSRQFPKKKVALKIQVISFNFFFFLKIHSLYFRKNSFPIQYVPRLKVNVVVNSNRLFGCKLLIWKVLLHAKKCVHFCNWMDWNNHWNKVPSFRKCQSESSALHFDRYYANSSNEIEKQFNILKSISNILHTYLLFFWLVKQISLLNHCCMFYEFGSRTISTAQIAQ